MFVLECEYLSQKAKISYNHYINYTHDNKLYFLINNFHFTPTGDNLINFLFLYRNRKKNDKNEMITKEILQGEYIEIKIIKKGYKVLKNL